ncbi:MAG: hypothetical protein WCI52_01745 [bacterium]
MNATKTNILNTKVLFWIFASAALGLFLSYAFLVNEAIMNVVNRQKAEVQISKISSITSDLEAKYIALENGINLPLAYSKGFQDAKDVTFITRVTDAPGRLSIRY